MTPANISRRSCMVEFAHPITRGGVGQERQWVAASNTRQEEIIKLDVGGSHFHVSRSILTATPNSLLDSMFSGRFRIDTQADSSVFIDRYVNVKAKICLLDTFCVAFSAPSINIATLWPAPNRKKLSHARGPRPNTCTRLGALPSRAREDS